VVDHALEHVAGLDDVLEVAAVLRISVKVTSDFGVMFPLVGAQRRWPAWL
jgi:hypothetical protein